MTVTHPLRQFNPVHGRHAKIGDQQVELPSRFFGPFQRCGSAIGDDHLVAPGLQERAKYGADVLFIIDYQDARRHDGIGEFYWHEHKGSKAIVKLNHGGVVLPLGHKGWWLDNKYSYCNSHIYKDLDGLGCFCSPLVCLLGVRLCFLTVAQIELLLVCYGRRSACSTCAPVAI